MDTSSLILKNMYDCNVDNYHFYIYPITSHIIQRNAIYNHICMDKTIMIKKYRSDYLYNIIYEAVFNNSLPVSLKIYNTDYPKTYSMWFRWKIIRRDENHEIKFF